MRIWDLKTGRCAKTIEAHGHFVTCLSWGRMSAAAASSTAVPDKAANGSGPEGDVRMVNVVASGSVDLVSVFLS
jgi:platelet-activating factor acetylhydrolase IB subunit alpha